MIENVFLTYANHSLTNEPKHFYKIFNEIISYISIPAYLNSDLENMIDLILEFARINDPVKAQEFLDHLKSDPNKINIQFPLVVFQQTYGYVYGYMEGYCEKTCPFGGISKIKALGKEGFMGSDRYKCYECEQKYLIYILENIIKDKEYSEIIGFSNFLNQAQNIIKTGLTIEKSLNPPFKEKLNKTLIWQPMNISLSIGHFLGGIISYSLGEFLLNNDRKKLNPCDECHKFYISKSIRKQRFCSDKCRLAWHNRKRIKSGEHAKYKRRKRIEGAKESYYG
jgi:NAD-dependent dihydropyrimidine dehydrogenase PreA subunit